MQPAPPLTNRRLPGFTWLVLLLLALGGFTLPGDTSGSDRYYRTDITAPFVVRDGRLDVPTAPGIGVDPLPDVLGEVTTSSEWLLLG